MTSARSLFGETRKYVGQGLRQHSYQSRGSLHLRDMGRSWALIHLQASTSSTARCTRLTVNVGSSLKEILSLDGKTRPTSLVDFHWRARLGELLPEAEDRWWVADEHNVHDVSAELLSAIVEAGIPAAEHHSDPEVLRSLWRAGPVPFLPEIDRLKWLLTLESRAGQGAQVRTIVDMLKEAAAGMSRKQEVAEHLMWLGSNDA